MEHKRVWVRKLEALRFYDTCSSPTRRHTEEDTTHIIGLAHGTGGACTNRARTVLSCALVGPKRGNQVPAEVGNQAPAAVVSTHPHLQFHRTQSYTKIYLRITHAGHLPQRNKHGPMSKENTRCEYTCRCWAQMKSRAHKAHTAPCASITSATFMKPEIEAPARKYENTNGRG